MFGLSCDFLIVLFYFFFSVYLGFFLSKKVKTLKEYAVADKNFSTPILVATLAASMIGGFATFGIAERVFSEGPIYIFVAFGMATNLYLVSKYIVPHLSKFKDAISVGDLMYLFYGKKGKVFAGIGTIIISIGGVATQVTATGYIFQYFFNMPFLFGVILSCGIVVSYSTFGGIRAVVATDSFQFAVLIIAIPLVCNIGVVHLGGYGKIFDALPESHKTLYPVHQSLLYYISLFLVFAVSFFEPIFIQRLLMAKNTEQSIDATKWTSYILFPLFILVGGIGLIALALNPSIPPNQVLPYIIDQTLPIILKGIAISGLLAVMMSTADSNLNIAGVAIIHDVLTPLRKKPLSNNTQLLAARVSTLIIGVMTIYIALQVKSIIDIMLYVFNFWAPTILVPLVLGILGFRVPQKTFLVPIIISVSFLLLWKTYGFDQYTGIDAIIPSVFISLILFISKAEKTHDQDEKNPKNLNQGSFSRFIPFKGSTIRDKFSLKYLNQLAAEEIKEYGAQYQIFSVFGIIFFSIPYFIFTFQQEYNIVFLCLRLVASSLCFLLLLKDMWPLSVQKYFPLIWYGTLCYSIPFLTTILLMSSPDSIGWSLNMVLAIFLMAFLVNWRSFLILLSGGFFFGVITTVLFLKIPSFDPDVTSLGFITYAYIFSFLISILFAKNRERSQAEKENNLKALAGIIAHEMRTPLASIYHAAHNLKPVWAKALKSLTKKDRETLPLPLEEYQDKPEVIEKLALRSQANIDLLLANIRNLKGRGRDEHISIAQVVKDTLKEYPQPSDIAISTDLDSDFQVMGDTRLIKQILFNLIKNAVDAMQKKGSIQITLGKTEDTQILTVRDEGCGMDPTVSAQIFQKFYTTKRHGTGLGLAFCKQAMNAMDGFITCHTEREKGTEFILHFPIHFTEKS